MNFTNTYRSMNAGVTPSPALIEKTLSHMARRQPPRYRRAAAIAAVLAVCLTVPALAAWTEPGYQLLYAVSPAAAQFFQPVRLSSVSGGVTMEVLAVRVENDTAQAYITLSGEAVDETCDLYDSASFHVPFDQSSHCERIGYDVDTNTAAFLVTAQTMDGSPIPGGKMTFSVGCFLSGKEKAENLAVPLDLASLAVQAETTDAYNSSGGTETDASMLLPGETLAIPAEGISLSAAGYADGFFQVQAVCRDNLRADNHCRLWLEDSGGNRLDAAYTAHFSNFSSGPDRLDFTQFAFDITPEALAGYTLRGDFWTSSSYTEGRWQVTFPLESTCTAETLQEIAEGHRTGSFDLQDTLLTFVSRLEREEGRAVRGKSGYDYRLYDGGDSAIAEFACSSGGTLLVWLERIPYQDTDGLWQPSAYAWNR